MFGEKTCEVTSFTQKNINSTLSKEVIHNNKGIFRNNNAEDIVHQKLECAQNHLKNCETFDTPLVTSSLKWKLESKI